MRTETRVGIFVLAAIGIFFYLSINIGALRLDKDRYFAYKTYFEDTGGIEAKASVKIAGVEVGWVEAIVLLEGGKAELTMMVDKRNRLARNAYAIIQQEGLIGQKTIEIDPGDPSAGYLSHGSVLSMPGKSPASVGDLLDQFRDIAYSVHDIATSFRNVFATREGEENMKKAVRGLANASERISKFSELLEQRLVKNEQNIDGMLSDFRKTAHHLEHAVPSITDDFHGLHNTLQDSVFPSMADGFESVKLALAGDRIPKLTDKMGNLSDKGANAFESFDDASAQAREGFRQVTEVVEKVNSGKGVLGKLINEDETYGDIKKTLKGFKSFVGKTHALGVYIDMHTETLTKTTLSKGYLEIKLRPTHDYFYQIQLVSDETGAINRDVIRKRYFDDKDTPLNVDELIGNGRDKIRFAERVDITHQHRNDILFGFQFGKRFNRFAARVGMFESTFGGAIDIYVPLGTDKFHWISTVEMFDFKGLNRIDDSRPHLKWINRAFILRNLYTTIGVDDFYSKRNASFFFGAGLRFGDDDLKYFASMLPIDALRRNR